MQWLSLSSPFNLQLSLECGQFFQWYPNEKGYIIQTGQKIFYLQQKNHTLQLKAIAGSVDEEFLCHFLRLDDDLSEIFNDWKQDPFVTSLFNRYQGLRLFRQDPWECLVSFVCSSASNIPRITSNLQTLSQNFGTEIRKDGQIYHILPTLDQLRRAPLEELYASGIGFRARYLYQITRILSEDKPVEALCNLSYDHSRFYLTQLPGIGDKIAECILLFSLGHLEAFPADTWIKKVLNRFYRSSPGTSSEKISAWAKERFGRNAGYAQQYLYHYARQQL